MRSLLHDQVRAFVGVPYRERGADPDAGWDCFGLVWWMRTHLLGDEGLDLFLTARAPDRQRLDRPARLRADSQALAHGRAQGRPWRRVSRQPGAVVLFTIGGQACHVGLVTRHHDFVHVRQGAETHMSNLNQAEWLRRVEGFYVPA